MDIVAETDVELERRIVSDPKVMAGKPVIRGSRLTVDHILNRLAHGDKAEDILAEYTYLQPDDIRACLLFASRCMEASPARRSLRRSDAIPGRRVPRS